MTFNGNVHSNDVLFYDNTFEDDCIQMIDVALHKFGSDKTLETTDIFKNDTHVYKRRWYILIVFNLYGATQCCFWNTWGPIATSSEIAFGWSDATVAWLTNWGAIAYVLSGLIFPWIMQVKGLRWAVLPSMFLIVVGSCFRVITSDATLATLFIHIGQFLNGLAGPISMAGVTGLSAAWFPPKERFTSTAISISFYTFGNALSFVLGPAFVAMNSFANVTSAGSTNNSTVEIRDLLTPGVSLTESKTSVERINEIKEQIMLYMYYECAWCCFVFLLLLLYFPSKPHIPPSVSAATKRENYWAGLWSLKGKTSYVLLAIVVGLSSGVVACWSALLNVNLRPYNISETEAGWIGFHSSISGCVLSIIIARFADLFARRIKMYIMIFCIISALCFLLFTLMLIGVIEFTRALLYSTTICGITLVTCATPLLYEFGCELAYPTSEEAANGILALLNNIGCIFFLVMYAIPGVGYMWMNWAVCGSVAACLPLLAILKSRFNRLEVDERVNLAEISEQQINVTASSQ